MRKKIIKIGEYEVTLGEIETLDYCTKDLFGKEIFAKKWLRRSFFYEIDGIRYYHQTVKCVIKALKDLRSILIDDSDCATHNEISTKTSFQAKMHF